MRRIKTLDLGSGPRKGMSVQVRPEPPQAALLQYALMSPWIARAQDEFFHSIRGRVRVVQGCGSEYHPHFPQHHFQGCTAVSQPREFDAVAIHVAHHGLVAGDDQLPQSPQVKRFAPEELDQLM